MKSRTKTALTLETHRQVRHHPVTRDLGGAPRAAVPSTVFDLGSSGGSEVASDKHRMIAEGFDSPREKSRRR
jgi:hypothetical protein